MFAGFLKDQRHVNGVDIACRVGGSGPGLLLLHGHPQTHVIWHKIAEQLAEHFTVVAADLRGSRHGVEGRALDRAVVVFCDDEDGHFFFLFSWGQSRPLRGTGLSPN